MSRLNLKVLDLKTDPSGELLVNFSIETTGMQTSLEKHIAGELPGDATPSTCQRRLLTRGNCRCVRLSTLYSFTIA